MRGIKYELVNEGIKQNALNAVREITPDPDHPLVVTIQEKTRSLEQNALLWALLTDISEQVTWYGRKLTPEDWKAVFTAAWSKAGVVPNLDKNGFVVLGQSTSRMSKSQFCELIELIYAFGTEHDVMWSDVKKMEADLAKWFKN